jgi:hypothetical protein
MRIEKGGLKLLNGLRPHQSLTEKDHTAEFELELIVLQVEILCALVITIG